MFPIVHFVAFESVQSHLSFPPGLGLLFDFIDSLRFTRGFRNIASKRSLDFGDGGAFMTGDRKT